MCFYLAFLAQLYVLRFIHVIACINDFLIPYYEVVFHCMNIPSFILSPTGGHLGCFWILAIRNKDAINILVYIFGR